LSGILAGKIIIIIIYIKKSQMLFMKYCYQIHSQEKSRSDSICSENVKSENRIIVDVAKNVSLLPKKEIHAGFVPSPKFNAIPFSLYAGIFIDAGYVNDQEFYAGNPLVNSWQYGYGAGLDCFTYYDLVFRLEYSFNKLGESGFFLHFTAPI
jgi:hypothetical protein